MAIEDILGRLEGVKKTGDNRWLARCPAHKDKTPSLRVTDAGGGRTLLHCFAGCGAADVLEAIGLHFGFLYPPEDSAGGPCESDAWKFRSEVRRHFRRDAFALILLGEKAIHGEAVTDDDLRRAVDAMTRIERMFLND